MEMSDNQLQARFFKYEFKALKEIFVSLIVTILIYSVYSGIIPGAALVISPKLIFAFLSLYIFRLIYKMLDRENYDESIEKILVAALWLWVPANYILSDSPYVFSFLLLLLYLKSQNFFLGQSLKVNPFLRIVLNSNFAFIISFYFFSVYMIDQRIFILNDKAILLSFALWLTYLAYQISKNLRGEEIEIKTDYVSAQLGVINSAVIVLGILLVQLGIFTYLSRFMLYKIEISLGLLTLYVIHYFVYHFYIMKGRDRDAKSLAPTTLMYGLSSLFIVFVAALLEFYL
jgi:hypothetical protein